MTTLDVSKLLISILFIAWQSENMPKISDFLSENVWFIPFFTGKYINFNGYWYYNVGTTITFMILLIIIIIFESFFNF